MRIRRRSAAILALAAAGALALAGIATATGDSTSTFSFSPKEVPKRHFQPGKLKVHTHTTYTGGTATDRARLFFDDDLKIKPKGIRTCKESNISGNKTMKAAMEECGRAKIGNGTAQAAAGTNTVHACVLAFNGKPSRGRPTILLFTRAQASPPFTIECSDPSNNTGGNTTVLLTGVFKDATGDFGTLLDIKNIATASPLPLTDFKTKVKKGRYVSARCRDRNHKWNLKTVFTYTTPPTTQTVNDSQRCKVKR